MAAKIQESSLSCGFDRSHDLLHFEKFNKLSILKVVTFDALVAGTGHRLASVLLFIPLIFFGVHAV